jgi:dihydroflavonol-4-reductase
VERFVLTSSLHTLAAGTAENPADEASAWNLECVDSPYARSKREAERLVRQANQSGFSTLVLAPGMVLGPRDPKPTSTRLVRMLARSRIVFLPGGGIPIVDAGVLALAHRRALAAGEAGERYAVVGPYVSYRALARLVAEISGRPWRIIPLADGLQRPLKASAGVLEGWRIGGELSRATVGGGFLRLHVSGKRADACFSLIHPPVVDSVRSSLGTLVPN